MMMRIWVKNYGIDVSVERISLKGVCGRIKISGNMGLFDRYDYIVIDGTYEEEETDTVSLFEEMIDKKPDIKEKARILLGRDIVQFVSPEDTSTLNLIRRCRALPNAIYGGKGNTKVDIIEKLVKERARRMGVSVDDRLLPGSARPEIVQLSSEVKAQIAKVMTELQTLRDITGKRLYYSPQNEQERLLLLEAKKASERALQDIHKYGQMSYRTTLLNAGEQTKEQ